jgi:hypothetical protein
VGRQAAASPPRVVAISPDDGSAIDLKNPALAAALSWLVPGLGQLYQGRTFKAILFMLPLSAVFLAGMWMGDGRVVYSSWRPSDRRLHFIGQAGIGAAAIPAIVQSALTSGGGRQPLGTMTWFVPPLVRGQVVSEGYARRLAESDPDIDPTDFRPHPGGRRYEPGQPGDQFSLWHRRLGRFYDLGTLYTTFAGLLNLLVIYDAWAGPMRPVQDESDEKNRSASGAKPRR